MNLRTCIVSRTEQPPERMIRFVVGPDNEVVADLKGNLPGRGCWVTCDRAMVEQAASKGLFSRAFKRKVTAQPDLAALIGTLMHESALQMVALAKKAGLAVPGQAKAEALIRNGDTELLLMSSDASADGVKKMGFALRAAEHQAGSQIAVYRCFSSDELDAATGGTNVMHCAFKRSGLAANLAGRLERLQNYLGDDAQKQN